MAAGTFWQHLENVHVGLGKAQLCWHHRRQTSSGTAKIDVGCVKEIPIPTVLLHWKAELWGARGVSPTWRELALWLHSIFLGLGETADIFSQLKIHWTCLPAYVLAAILLLWHAIKATEPACQARGLCFHWWNRWFFTLSTTRVYWNLSGCTSATWSNQRVHSREFLELTYRPINEDTEKRCFWRQRKANLNSKCFKCGDLV